MREGRARNLPSPLLEEEGDGYGSGRWKILLRCIRLRRGLRVAPPRSTGQAQDDNLGVLFEGFIRMVDDRLF